MFPPTDVLEKPYYSLLLNLEHFASLATRSTGRSRRPLSSFDYLDGFRCFPARMRQPVLLPLQLLQAEHDPRLRRLLRGCGGDPTGRLAEEEDVV